MAKITETVALVKKKQGKFSKKVRKVKTKVQKGEVIVKENVIRGKKPKQDRGVVYLAHIPHGFYEPEMIEYFKQFGKVTNVRVCRSAKTAESKGYGFIEFEDTDVAKVVAETMDNYLMFKRRLESKYIPPEKQNKNMFKGVPWTKKNIPIIKERDVMNRHKNSNIDDETYLKKANKQFKKLTNTLDKLAAMGIKHTIRPVNVPESMTKLVDDYYSTSDKSIKAKKAHKNKPVDSLTAPLIDNDSDSDLNDSEVEVKVKKAHKNKLAVKAVEFKSKTKKSIQKKKDNIFKSKKEKTVTAFTSGKAKLAKGFLDNSDLVQKTKIKKNKTFKKK